MKAKKWDNRELGADERFVRISSREKSKNIDNSLGLVAITTRIKETQRDELREIAQEKGIGYQPLIRMILSEYIEKNKHSLDKCS